GAAAAARLAHHRRPHRHLVLRAEHRLHEVEVDDQLEIRAPQVHGTTAAPRAEAGVAEERLEDVAQPAAEPAEEILGGAPAAAPQPLDAVHVVAAPALGVAQELV